MTGILGLGDAPEGPIMDAPKATGPRVDRPPERPAQGPSTFLVVKTPTCQWCARTMDFLEALREQRGDFEVEVLDAQERPDAFENIRAHTRRTTVPQVFLDGSLIGGWNELATAAKKGQLDAYLDGEDWRASAPPAEAPRRWWRRRS